MKKSLEEGNVVRSYNIGLTCIKICDDYCRDKTVEEGQKILDKSAARILETLRVRAALEQQRE